MNKGEIGLSCLLIALFFAIVAGGHVSMDAKPEGAAALGVVLTLVSAGLAAYGVACARTDKTMQAFACLSLSAILVVLDLLSGGDMFATIRTLVAALVFGGLAYQLGKNRVNQMPTTLHAGFLALLVAAMGTSILVSEFKWISADAWINWLVFAAALYLTVATVGRVRGPRLVIETVVFAIALVALKGVFEYLGMRAEEPTYRIFADWNNPNALAGLLVAGIPLSAGVALVSAGMRRSLAWAGGALMVVALALTQSKGGILVLPVSLVALVLCLFVWRTGKPLARAGIALAPILIGALFVFVVQATTPKKAPGAPLSRLSVAGAEQAQSSEYRKLLWQGAKDLALAQPVGYGAGTYRYYSAVSGLTEQTHLAHQTYLQVAVEGGWVALIGLLGLAVVWTVRVFAGARALDEERNLLRASVFAAVVAFGANGFVESNVFFFGTGLLLFVLVGLGLQLAADGTSPESLPGGLRGMIAVCCCGLPMAFMVWVQYVENGKSGLMSAIAGQDRSAVEGQLNLLKNVGAFDGESWYLRAQLERDSKERLALFARAAQLAPTTRTLRALAKERTEQNDIAGALATLKGALAFDRNNLRTLKQLLDTQIESGDETAATATAVWIIGVEDSVYLKVRALPELVPTEPFEARVFLAERTDPKNKVAYLRAALDGYARYKALTVPRVLAFDKEGLDYAGQSKSDAERHMAQARDVANELIELYGASGDSKAVEEVRGLLSGLTVD